MVRPMMLFSTVSKTTSRQVKNSLKKDGIYLNVHDSSDHDGEKTEEYLFINELIEAGKIKPVIDRIYPLEQMVEAHRYVDLGHKKGNVVITVGHD